ncbi:MAG: TlpA family protein disulfide reductase [Pseudomonadales bacterium]
MTNKKKSHLLVNAALACWLCAISATAVALKAGDPVPRLLDPSRPDIDDLLAQHVGKVVYVDFWASWCGPCRRAVPALNELYQQFQGDGFEVIAVNVDEDAADMNHFLQRYPISYANIADPQGFNAEQFQVQAMPTGFLIDRKGHVVVKHTGFLKNDKAKLQAAIRLLLSKSN